MPTGLPTANSHWTDMNTRSRRTTGTTLSTGAIRSVKGTPMDFTQATPIGARINDSYEQIALARGYDHNFVIDRKEGTLQLAARVREPKSGRVLEAYTTQPGIQLYSGNFLD